MRRRGCPLTTRRSTERCAPCRSSTSSIRCRFFDRFVACYARQRPSWSRSPTDASPPRRPRSGSTRPTNSTSCSFVHTSKLLADGSISPHRTGRRPPATRCTQCGRARDQDDELAFAARSRLHGATLVPLRACSYAKPIRTDCALGLWDEDGKPSRKTSTKKFGGPNGIRTRVSALRGPCPGPLDDGAVRGVWLGEEDSNPRYVVQSHASYH